MKKNYIVDTNVLLEDLESLKVLINGDENKIIIPDVVLDELDGLKKNQRLKWRAIEAIKKINEHASNIEVLYKKDYAKDSKLQNDDLIILGVKHLNSIRENVILVTNDEMMHFKCLKENIKSEKYLKSIPFQTDSERYTGFVDVTKSKDECINNSFYWNDEGKLIYHKDKNDERVIDYENEIWKIKPKDKYQNAAMTLLLDDTLDLITIQSEAGFR